MIQRGDIIFVMHHDNKLSKLFAWFMMSDWSHCGIFADVGSFDEYIHETSDTQTKVGLFSLYENDPNCSFVVVRVPGITPAAMDKAAQYHNKLYGYVRLLGAAVRCLAKRIGFKSFPMIWKVGGPLCMMLPHAALKVVYDGMPSVGDIDTQDLYLWCLEHGEVILSKERG